MRLATTRMHSVTIPIPRDRDVKVMLYPPSVVEGITIIVHFFGISMGPAIKYCDLEKICDFVNDCT